MNRFIIVYEPLYGGNLHHAASNGHDPCDEVHRLRRRPTFLQSPEYKP